MSAVCAHADVADPRHQSRALDAFPSASSCTILGTRSYLEPSAFYASMGGHFDRIVRHWSADIYCLHCGYRKCGTERQRAVKQSVVQILTQHSGFILVASDDITLQQRQPDDLEP
jgi:hypothetical protein